jgi:hypothetical protein
MKKSELKTGMWVEVTQELNNWTIKEMAIVLLGTESGDIVAGQTWFPLSTLDDNLEDKNCNVKITKIYQPTNNIDYVRKSNPFDFESKEYELIWRRTYYI